MPSPFSRRTALQFGGAALTGSLAGCSTVLGGDSVAVEWDTSPSHLTGGLAAEGETVYVCTERGLATVEDSTGERGWEFPTGQNETSSRPVVAAGTVFFGTLPLRSNQAHLYAVSTTGEGVWDVPLPGGVSTSEVHNGSVFVASGVMSGGEYGLYAFDARSGDRRWGIPLDSHPVGSSPTVAEGTVYIESGGFAAVDAETGDLNWRIGRETTEVGEAARHSPTVGDETVYFSYSFEPEVYAFDAETGEKRWMVETNARTSKPVLDGRTLYVGTTDFSPDDPAGKLYALDATTGDEQWSITTGDVPLEGPVVTDGTVYTAGHDTLYAIEGHSGETVWKYEFHNGISAPVLTDEHAIVYTHRPDSSDPVLYALSR